MYIGGVDPALNNYLLIEDTQYPVILIGNEIGVWSFEFGAVSFGDPTNSDKISKLDSYPL